MVAENYREAVVATAAKCIGSPSKRYQANHPERGQSEEDGFDCSGFVRFVLTSAGLTIPDYIGMDDRRRPIRHANEFWDHYGVGVHTGLHQPGDLLFFSRNGRFPTHIGIVAGEDMYIHAPGRDGTLVEEVRIEHSEISPQGIAGAIYGRNPIGFKALALPLENPTYRYHQQIVPR